MKYKNNTNKKQVNYFNPIIIGIILIALIISYSLWQTFHERQQLEKLDKKILEEQAATSKINVALVSAEEVYQWIGNKHVQLIDIRDASEYTIKHIESSTNIPLDTLKENINKINKDKKIVIIDRDDSNIGKTFTQYLEEEGLNSNYLKGGILNYARQNYPLITIGNPKNITDQIKVPLITAQKVKEKLLNGTIFSFIDTRPQSSYATNNINGSKNIPLESIENSKNIIPSHTILLYDDDTTRSFKAGVKLYDMGIFDIYSCSDNYSILKKILFKKNK